VGRDPLPWNDMRDVVGATFNEEACSVTASLEPSSAILIWGTVNGLHDYDPFLTNMKVGEAGETLSRRELVKGFRKRSRFVYTFDAK
jgi:hypothetical protein